MFSAITRATLLLSLLPLILLVAPPAYSQPVPATLVGNTPTEFDVTYGGAASYKVPIMLPTGAAGVKPSVSLNYNSQFGNGVMGLGWQLSAGLARIERCYKRNTSQIIYCLNGEELLPVTSGYYRTEVDTGVLVHALNASTFELQFENGTTKVLTRQLTAPDVYLESTHTQRGGASYSVNWRVDTTHREPLVDSITYQGNEIEFIYQDRNDRRNGYWMGAPRNLTQRLQSVIARADGETYRQYNVHYEYDSVSSLSKVTRIQECVGSGECLPALSFNWTDSGEAGLAFEDSVRSGQIFALEEMDNDGYKDVISDVPPSLPDYHLYADLDGDGRQDVIEVDYRDAGDAGERPYVLGNWLQPDAQIRTADLNGDGKDDVIVRDNETNRGLYVISRDAGPRKIWSRIDPNCYAGFQFADVNGDQLPDLIYYPVNYEPSDLCEVIPGPGLTIHLNRGNYQFESLPSAKIGIPAYANAPQFVDLNGDNTPDLFYQFSSRFYYLNGLGDGNFSGGREIKEFEGNFSGTFADFNADGLVDNITAGSGEAQVRYNQGEGFFSDYVKIPNDDLGCKPSFFVGDYNGDGAQDVIWQNGYINFTCDGRGRHTNHLVSHASADYPYIDTFTDANGNQHRVDYAKLTDEGVYTRDPYDENLNFDEARPYQQALTVVKSLTTPNHQVYYKYAGARLHKGEHGYLGFKSLTSVLVKEDEVGDSQSLVTVSYLHQDFPLIGKLQAVKKKVYPGEAAGLVGEITYEKRGDQNYLVAVYNDEVIGQPADDTTPPDQRRGGTGTDFTGQMNSYFDWQSLDLGGGIFKTVLAEKVVDHLQLSNDALTKTEITTNDWALASSGLYARLLATTNSTLDAFGGLLQEQQVNLDYETTDSLGGPAAFLIDRSTTLTRYLGNATEDTHTLTQTFDYYSSGLVQYQTINPDDSQGTRSYFEYDSYGNTRLAQVEALNPSEGHSEVARSSTMAYINQGKYLEYERNSLGQQSSYQNYNAQGLPGQIIDPKGLSTGLEYDALGRIERVTDYLGNVHTTERGYCSDNPQGCTNGAYRWEHSIPAGGSQQFTWWNRKGQVVKTAAQSLQPGQWIVQAVEYDPYGRASKTSVPMIQSLSTAIAFTETSDRRYTENTYDELNRVTTKRLPGVNRVVTKDYENELNVITTDPLGRITRTITNALGQVTQKIQPDNNNVLFTYNAQGLVKEQRYPRLDNDGNVLSGQYQTVTNTYDRYGNPTQLDDPERGLWRYDYNAFNELIQQTDARGQQTHFTYDELGRLRTQRDSEYYAVWNYDGQAPGLVDSIQQYAIASLSPSAQAALTPENVAGTAGVSLSWQQRTLYDGTTLLPSSVETQQRDANNALVSTNVALDYDGFGRLQTEQLPAAYINQGSLSAPRIRYEYSDTGYLHSIRDADSGELYQEVESIDAFGNITQQRLATGVELYRGYSPTTGWASDLQASNTSGLIVDQSYSQYNALGHIGQRDDAVYYRNGSYQSWTDRFEYNDALNQQLTDVSIQYAQDINGVVLNADWSHHYQYDALGNRRTSQVLSEPVGPAPTDTELAVEQLRNRLPGTVLTDPAIESSLLPTSLTLGSNAYTRNDSKLISGPELNQANFSYQSDGSFIKTAESDYPNGMFQSSDTLAANTDGSVSITMSDVDALLFIGLTPADEEVFFHNAYKFSLNYGQIDILVGEEWIGSFGVYTIGDVLSIERVGTQIHFLHNGNLLHTVEGAVDSALVLQGIVYNEGAGFGLITTSFTDTSDDDDSTRRYYPLAAGSTWENIARDLYGTTDTPVELDNNPTVPSANAMTYGYQGNRLSTITGSLNRSYQYDDNGNVINDGEKTSTFNAHNKVRDITLGSEQTRFQYDPDRSRRLRVDTRTEQSTETLYIGNYERVRQTGTTNRVEHKYHIGGIALVIQTEGANTDNTHALISDYQGSLIAITDTGGDIQQRFRYNPYGKQVDVSQGVTSSAQLTTTGYTSHEHIEAMDLIHMGGRLYDPSIGRMVQADPIVQAPTQILSYNRYAYVWNNPFNRIDPTGYESEGAGADGTGFGDSTEDPVATSDNDAAIKGDDKTIHLESTFRGDKEAPGISFVFGGPKAPDMSLEDMMDEINELKALAASRGVDQVGLDDSVDTDLGGLDFADRPTWSLSDGNHYYDDLHDDPLWLAGRGIREQRFHTRLDGGNGGGGGGGGRASGSRSTSSNVQKGAANPKVKKSIKKGKKAHKEFAKKVKGKKGWQSEPQNLIDPATGKKVIPDAVTPSGRPVELKPNTPSGRRQGRRQLRKYERATGKKGKVIYYDP